VDDLFIVDARRMPVSTPPARAPELNCGRARRSVRANSVMVDPIGALTAAPVFKGVLLTEETAPTGVAALETDFSVATDDRFRPLAASFPALLR
jgi:hypothetical protein